MWSKGNIPPFLVGVHSHILNSIIPASLLLLYYRNLFFFSIPIIVEMCYCFPNHQLILSRLLKYSRNWSPEATCQMNGAWLRVPWGTVREALRGKTEGLLPQVHYVLWIVPGHDITHPVLIIYT